MEKPILVNFVNFSKIVCDFLTFLTANNKNNKQCLIDGVGFIVKWCNIAPKLSYHFYLIQPYFKREKEREKR